MELIVTEIVQFLIVINVFLLIRIVILLNVDFALKDIILKTCCVFHVASIVQMPNVMPVLVIVRVVVSLDGLVLNVIENVQFPIVWSVVKMINQMQWFVKNVILECTMIL